MKKKTKTMGNLFLKEKENWLAWSIWGITGAFIALFMVLKTNNPLLIAASSLGLLVILTWWMKRSNRFDFGRAFKICSYVLLLSVLPGFIFIIMPNNVPNRSDLIFQGITLLILSLIACLVCSWIARKPKQYY